MADSKRLIAVTVMLLFLALIPATTVFSQRQQILATNPSSTEVTFRPAYENHPRITITSNGDFSSQGWPGAGTELNPYIIEGLNITGNFYANIDVRDTTAHFVIRDCFILGTENSDSRGINLINVINARIESCVIVYKRYGLQFVSSQNCKVMLCNLTRTFGNGMDIENSEDCTISHNKLTNFSGVGIQLSRTLDSNISNNTIDTQLVSAAGVGIRVGTQSQRCIVANNTVYDSNPGDNSQSYGIFIGHSNSCSVINNLVYDLSLSGIELDRTHDIQVINNEAYNNGRWGLLVDFNCKSVTISGNLFHNNTYEGVRVASTDDCIIENNILTKNGQAGVRIFQLNTIVFLCENSTVINNTVCDNGRQGIAVGSSFINTRYSNISNNIVSGNREEGIFLSRGERCVVFNNHLSGNGLTTDDPAVKLWNSVHCTVENNTIHSGNRGIVLTNTSSCPIVANTLVNNADAGIALDSISSNNSIYWNSIGWNKGGNAWDEGVLNHWDDGVATGNAWNDYSGDGSYSVSGPAGSIDRYPSRLTEEDPPVVNHPSDIVYDEGSTGHSITWSPSEQHPHSYVVEKNSSNFASGLWDGLSITVSVDGLNPGVYNFTLTVLDDSGNSVTDTVFVSVIDITYPTIDSPSDFEYTEGSMGHTITWSPSDNNPDAYEVLKNGTMIHSGIWNGSGINVNLDGLNAGVYNYTLVVYDESGNSASDTVFVTVIESVPMIDNPDDIQYESGTTGNTIVWSTSDLTPDFYVILRNGTQIDSGPWDGSDIEISIDGLDLGIYNFTLVVNGTSGNSASDTVMVSVVDTSDPVLNNPGDIMFKVGDTGQNITWILHGVNPFNYEVFMNVTLTASGTWNSTGETVTVALDGLSAGVHFFTIYITDLAGHETSDMVIVTVLPESTTTVTPTSTTTPTTTTDEITMDTNDPIPFASIVLLLASIGGVCGIIALIVVIKRK